MRKLLTFVLLSIIVYGCSSDDNVISSLCGAPDKPCGVGCADANPKTMLPNDT